MAHTLPALPYALDALEPHIDAMTMGIHHGRGAFGRPGHWLGSWP